MADEISIERRPKVLVFSDGRESKSDTALELLKYDCVLKTKLLHVADYLCSDRVAIEKKTASDFVSSIMDKRLFSQIRGLKDNFEKPLLMIEGNNFYERINPNIVRGALAAITIDFSLPIIWTRDAAESAGMIYWIAKREQFVENRTFSLRNDKKSNSTSEKQEVLISGLPGINVVRAQSLLTHFKKPKNIFTASPDDFKKVKGIGEKTAKNILDILESEYE